MKRLVALLMALIIVLTFAACGDKGGKGEGTTKADVTNTTSPAADDTGVKFKQIIQGYALDVDGNVWTVNNYEEPSLFFEGGFESINGGNWMFAGLTADGALWTWGKYPGNGSADKIETPVKVLDGVKCVSVNSENGYAILNDGSFYQWGYGNNMKHLRLDGYDKDDILTPTKVDVDIKFASVTSGNNAAVAFDVDGQRYCWCATNQIMGYSAAQVGTDHTDDMTINQFWLQPIQNDVAPKGTYFFGQGTTYLIDENNTLYVSGGAGSKLAPFCNEPSWKVFTKARDNVARIFSAMYGTIIVDTDGNIWGWGGKTFALTGEVDTPVQITKDIKFVDAVIIGDHDIVALDDAGHLYLIREKTKTPEMLNVK